MSNSTTQDSVIWGEIKLLLPHFVAFNYAKAFDSQLPVDIEVRVSHVKAHTTAYQSR